MKKIIGIDVIINENGNLCCMVNDNINTNETGIKIICLGDELTLKFTDVRFNITTNNWVSIPRTGKVIK